MAEYLSRQPRHPIATRYPIEPPPRIEMRVRRGHHSREYVYQDSDVICNCFPRPSTHTIPSMFYDAIKCPHKHDGHIQPAQETQFNYPWTASSLRRKKNRGPYTDYDHLSVISEGGSPDYIRERQDDELSIATAPPFRYMPDNDPRQDPPFTAPEQATDYLAMKRRAASLNDVRHHGFDPPKRHGNSRLDNRQFTGSYVDPSK